MNKKNLTLLALAAVAFTGNAYSQVTIRITGSTAFRSSTHNAIRNILKPGFTYAYSAASAAAFATSNQAIYKGTTKEVLTEPTSPETNVIIKVSFGGSTGGIQNLVENINNDPAALAWLSSTEADVPTTIAGRFGENNGPYDAGTTGDVTMADSFQSTTNYPSPELTGSIVAVLPFQWMRNKGAPNKLRNMNPWLATNLLSGGLKLSFFSGNAADTIRVYACGRDELSGTRTVTFADCLFGTNSNCEQYRVDASALTLWPANPPYPAGHTGYPSSNNLVTAMNTAGTASFPTKPGYLVGYAGVTDAAAIIPSATPAAATATISAGSVNGTTITTGGDNYGVDTVVTFTAPPSGVTATGTVVLGPTGVVTGIIVTNAGSGYTVAPTISFSNGASLRWNGVPYTPDNVRTGAYTFWSYQLLYYRNGYAQSAIAEQIATQIRDVDAATAGILVGTMQVERTVEGGDVTPL